jgi:hypothetical protein
MLLGNIINILFPLVLVISLVFVNHLTVAAPTAYPTDTTIYNPTNTWNEFNVLTILDTSNVIVVDMNDNMVKE